MKKKKRSQAKDTNTFQITGSKLNPVTQIRGYRSPNPKL